MAKGCRCLDGQSWEVAAMAKAETVMARKAAAFVRWHEPDDARVCAVKTAS